MTDWDIIFKISKYFGTDYIHTRTRPNKKWKTSWRVMVRGPKAVRLMKKLLPFMGERRSAQIKAALKSSGSKG